MSLIDKLKKSRETILPVGKYSFTLVRPTDMQIYEAKGNLKKDDIFRNNVKDWSGVTELDIIPGGTNVPVPFDTDLFIEWIADQPDLWAEIIAGVYKAYESYKNRMDESLGKPIAG